MLQKSFKNPFRGMDVVLLCYDICNPNSLNIFNQILPELKHCAPCKIIKNIFKNF